MSAVKRFLAGRRSEYVSLEDLIMGIASANDCTVAEAAELLATVLRERDAYVYRKSAHRIDNTYKTVDFALAKAAILNNFRYALELEDVIPF